MSAVQAASPYGGFTIHRITHGGVQRGTLACLLLGALLAAAPTGTAGEARAAQSAEMVTARFGISAGRPSPRA
ncbi:MAG TPA: hypothetical protein VHS99_23520 [Chloroflexota bacterium]|jgi:hypothetical protein|nr:hypothetical protein [Chloroflexota bacterium]